MRRSPLVVIVLAVASLAHAQDVESMPDTRGLDHEFATQCARGVADACVTAADACFRSGDASRASALYRRGADLARHALHVPARPGPPGRIRSVAAAITALEGAWDVVVVRGAGAHGQRAVAAAAEAQVFGEHAVASWSGHRSTFGEAFRAVHTWTHREDGAFANGVWVGTLHALAGDGACWQLSFSYMNLDFVAFVDDQGHVVALVHIPEG